MLASFCGYECVLFLQGSPVEHPFLCVSGLIFSLLLTALLVSRMDVVESYTLETFEKRWIQNRKKQKGLAYHDRPGCYVILGYRFRRLLPFHFGYRSAYAGQSMHVYRRVHNHLNRKGNGDVYADVRDGLRIEIEIYPCSPAELNRLERKLIRKYHAEDYYNRTAGGGTKRGIFRS